MGCLAFANSNVALTTARDFDAKLLSNFFDTASRIERAGCVSPRLGSRA